MFDVIWQEPECLIFPDDAWGCERNFSSRYPELCAACRQDVLHPVRAGSIDEYEHVTTIHGVRFQRCLVRGAGGASDVRQDWPLPVGKRAGLKTLLLTWPHQSGIGIGSSFVVSARSGHSEELKH